MKTLKYILSVILGLVVAISASAQVDHCSDTPVSFDPEVIMREYEPPVLSDYPAPAPPQSLDKRKIWFVHGLAGNQASWASGNAYTLQNWSPFVSTKMVDYLDFQKGDLWQASAKLFSDMDPGNVNDPQQIEAYKRDFIIAHSLGGLVARRLEQHYYADNVSIKPYGGIVTFGTPHLGSHLADFKVNKHQSLQHFVNITCKSLLAGPVEEKVKKNLFTRWIDRMLFWTDVSDWVSKPVCDKVSTIGLTMLEKMMTEPIEASIVPGSADLQAMANIPSPQSALHTIAFWGEEFDNDDMAIRFLFSATKDVNSYPLMQADAMDDDALKDASEMVNIYLANYRKWRSRSKSIFGGRYNGKYYTQGDMIDLAHAWYDGVKWFGVLNPRWKSMIGTTVSASNGTMECFCDCRYEDKNYASSGFAFDILHSVDCGLPMACGIYEMDKNYNVQCDYIENEVMQYYETTSDGVVTRESAVAFPNAKYQPIRMVGSGHMQMRNDSQLEGALKLLYTGGVHSYFKLEE